MGGVNDNDFSVVFEDAFNALGTVNLAIFGKTGVGKSTLVNAFFGTDVAATGIGQPVTRGLKYYDVPNRPFGFYDSQGFETGEAADDILGTMRRIIDEKRHGSVTDQVHAIWYCVRSADKRFEESQAQFVRQLAVMGVPVIIVLTQVPKKDGVIDPEAEELADSIRAQFTDGVAQPRSLVMTNAKPNNFLGLPEHGLEELLDKTAEIVPDAVRNALIAAQQVNLTRKRSAAWKTVGAAAAGAAAAAAIPIPFADLAALLPIEAAMFGKVSAIYGLPVALTVLVGQGARAAGAKAVETLLTFVPGVNVAVGVVQAGVASTLTLAAGAAWMVVCEQVTKRGPAAARAAFEGDELSDLFRDAVTSTHPPCSTEPLIGHGDPEDGDAFRT